MCKRKVSFDRRYFIFVKGGSTVSTLGFVPLPDRFRTRDWKTGSFFKYLAVVRTNNLNCKISVQLYQKVDAFLFSTALQSKQLSRCGQNSFPEFQEVAKIF